MILSPEFCLKNLLALFVMVIIIFPFPGQQYFGSHVNFSIVSYIPISLCAWHFYVFLFLAAATLQDLVPSFLVFRSLNEMMKTGDGQPDGQKKNWAGNSTLVSLLMFPSSCMTDDGGGKDEDGADGNRTKESDNGNTSWNTPGQIQPPPAKPTTHDTTKTKQLKTSIQV